MISLYWVSTVQCNGFYTFKLDFAFVVHSRQQHADGGHRRAQDALRGDPGQAPVRQPLHHHLPAEGEGQLRPDLQVGRRAHTGQSIPDPVRLSLTTGLAVSLKAGSALRGWPSPTNLPQSISISLMHGAVL